MKRAGVLALITAVSLLAVAAFADEFPMRNSTTEPAAVGVVHANTDRNGNLDVEVAVKHLAPPQRLAPPHQNYVVWVQAPGKQPENIGMLRINGDDMAGSLRTKVIYRSFDIFVTAEDNPHPDSPMGPEVLRGTVQK
jgi:hypothetical protein